MGKFYLGTTVLIVFILIMGSTFLAGPKIPELEERDGVLWAGDGWMKEYEGLKVTYFTGTPEEMGIQHGLLVMEDAEKVRDTFRAMDPAHQAEGLGERLGWFFKNLYARLQFYPAFLRHTPQEYLDEMRGFVLGASGGTDRNIYEVYMGNASQDLQLAAPGCSSFAAWGDASIDGDMYVGRNLDHGGMIDMAHYQFVGFYNPREGYPFVVHNYPSMIGTMSGMNDQGIVIASNYSMVKAQEMTLDGLPYMLMLREALQYGGSLEEVLKIITETPRTIGLNLMVADAVLGKAVIVEASANRLQIREADNFIFASNQFRHPHMQEFQAPGWLASAMRDQRFQELAEEFHGLIDVPVSREIMRDKYAAGSLARAGFVGGINTEVCLASMVFAPGQGEIWLGVVEENGWSPYPADALFVGLDAKKIWETGKPQPLLGTLPPTTREGYEKYWFKVRDAKLHIQRWENKEALALVEKVLAEYPKAESPLLIAGRACMRLGRYEEAEEYFTRLLDREEFAEPFNKVRALFWNGLMKDLKGDRQEARRLYELALEVLVPDMPEEVGGFRDLARAGLEQPLTIGEDGGIRPK